MGFEGGCLSLGKPPLVLFISLYCWLPISEVALLRRAGIPFIEPRPKEFRISGITDVPDAGVTLYMPVDMTSFIKEYCRTSKIPEKGGLTGVELTSVI